MFTKCFTGVRNWTGSLELLSNNYYYYYYYYYYVVVVVVVAAVVSRNSFVKDWL
jgi:hypothetical protein